jgi:CheY-like chemotaxis protein
MVTTMRETEVFLLQACPKEPDRPRNHGTRNSFILVVEDDAPTLRLEQVIMEEEGYRVEAVGNGEAALEFLTANSPSLVLLDIGLPGMDGIVTCAKIREISEVPIIMVTGRDCLEDKVKSMDAGADDYVTKPFLTHELAIRVKVVLRRTKAVGNEAQSLDAAAHPFPAAIQQPSPDAIAREGASTENSTPMLPAGSELPGTPNQVPESASPTAAGRSYEGAVRLVITTLGPVRNLISFVSELRQSPKFRLLRLVANQRTEGMDIWLGLRGPLPLIELLTDIHGVHSVVSGDIPNEESGHQMLIVTLD